VIGRSTGANGVPIALTANQSWNVGSGGLTARQRISGAFGLTKTGSGTLTLSGIINGVSVGNTYTGSTKIDAGILVLSSSITNQDSAFDTSSVAGDATNGLRIAATTLTLGGLKGSESFASRFTTTTGGYAGLTALTLNPGTGVTHSYSGDIGNGAGALTVTKTGLGTQILGTSTNTGDTAVNVGTLLFSTGAGTSGSNVTVASGATGGVLVAGLEGQHTRSGTLSLSNNSSLRIDYGVNSPNTSVAPLSVGTFSPGTGITLQMVGTVAAGVPYPLVTWTTGPTDASAFNPILMGGLVGSLTVSASTLSVTFSTPAPASWNTGNGTWDTTTSNWLKAGNPSTFANGLDGVIFGDESGIGVGVNPIITLDTTVTPIGVTMNTTGRNYTVSGLGAIAGPAGLTLASGNTGTLTLTTANTYTGDTQVTGGTLRLGDGGTGGSLAAASPITLAGGTSFVVNQSDAVAQGTDFGVISGDGSFSQIGAGTTTLNSLNTFTGPISVTNGALEIGATGRLGGGTYAGGISITAGASIFQYGGTAAQTLSGIISGPGSLAKASGSGILTLSGENTYQGATTIGGGTLRLANVAAVASTSTISITGGATLQPTIHGISINAPITLGATGTTAQINGPFTPSAGGTVETLTLNQPITGDGNLRLFGSSELNNTNSTIVLNAQNSYAGNTELDTAGTAVHLSGVNLFVKSGINNALPATTVLTIDGDVGRGSGRTAQFDLNGFNQTLAGLTNVTTGTGLRIQRVTNTGPFATLTINNSADFSFGSTSDVVTSTQPSAKITGNINLTKSGTGTFTLVGIHQYAGNTTVNEGILSLSAENAFNNAFDVTIAPAATLNLDFTGTETVNRLFIGTTQQISGVYGAIGSGAQFETARITGTGTLTVVPGGYTAWASTNAGGQGAELDFDNDGVQNGVEFFMNSPAGFTATPQLSNTDPRTITWTNGGNIPAFAYGAQFVVETSSDLSTWTPVLLSGLTTNTNGPGGSLTYTLTGASPRFVRLKVISY
jgi:autotransporter-associated beta strand protein